MNAKQAKYPQLRFKGFTDPWEERKLNELFLPSKNKNNNGLYNQKDILAASLGTELIPKKTFFGLKSTEESVKNYSIVKSGDLIYTKSPIKGFPNGIIRTNKGNVGIVPSLYCVYALQKDIHSSIIQLYFEDKNRLNFYLFPLVNVGARNNVNITDLEFLEGKVIIPKSYEEQSEIVQFIEQLNTTIALHQRKLDKLKELKQGYLQKMFPKNGSKFPKLRFAGFADAWEERKLGAITDSFSGGTPTAGKAEYYGGEIPFIRSGEISSDSTELFITDAGLNNSSAKMVGIGDILYALYGATSGETSISRINGAINQAILAIRPTKGDDPYMIVQWLKKQKETIISTYLQGGQGNLSGSIVKDLLITLPKNKDEQAKVGSFFKQLDQTITLHQSKLEKLQELKKGYLQKMFC
ncbi:restriction endonuclease subunit S (plasmid) [Lacticaseibacillus paracasei]|uniref:restriction endonuclease subunit S n=1 Tax=Lacticaseibacillus paracasei TaxID=1597 RepID=UPI0023584005|nr:restriction endonuclease subunit S [Lacticaseibacillus paracasei]WCZ20742.1 restriction endonuclease subunit S [Lacticaseibacillus paracasei]